VGVQVESLGLVRDRVYVGGRPSEDDVKEEPEDSEGAIVTLGSDVQDYLSCRVVRVESLLSS
jgi:hypothetical protein